MPASNKARPANVASSVARARSVATASARTSSSVRNFANGSMGSTDATARCAARSSNHGRPLSSEHASVVRDRLVERACQSSHWTEVPSFLLAVDPVQQQTGRLVKRDAGRERFHPRSRSLPGLGSVGAAHRRFKGVTCVRVPWVFTRKRRRNVEPFVSLNDISLDAPTVPKAHSHVELGNRASLLSLHAIPLHSFHVVLSDTQTPVIQ